MTPTNLEEAIDALNKMLSDEDKEYLKTNGAISVHHSLGRWIRNEWNLWTKSVLYENISNESGFTHPDDISNYIIEEFIKQLN